MNRNFHHTLWTGGLICSLVFAPSLSAQTEGTGGRCIPVSERAGRTLGCFIVATQAIGPLDGSSVFWHLTTFPTRAEAEKAKDARGAVVESLGKVWLLEIGEPAWRAPGGKHVAAIGPLPVTPGVAYTAQYMEAVFRPGMKSSVHRHSGVEAWYTLAGETCLETSEGRMVGRPGGRAVIVPGGLPMELTATGSNLRRSVVLVLHDSAQPFTLPASDWIPKGLCTR